MVGNKFSFNSTTMRQCSARKENKKGKKAYMCWNYGRKTSVKVPLKLLPLSFAEYGVTRIDLCRTKRGLLYKRRDKFKVFQFSAKQVR